MGNGAGDSVTRWLHSLRHGDRQAADKLWDRYYGHLVEVAKRQIGVRSSGAKDEEDVVISVFDTLVRGIEEGRFSQLRDRSDLWCLLIAITRQKTANLKRHESRQKRGGGRVRTESAFGAGSERAFALDTLCGDVPTPDFLVALDEEHAYLMGLLRNDGLRQIAKWTLEGYAASQIGEKLNVSVRTVQRKLTLIRATWSEALLSRGASP